MRSIGSLTLLARARRAAVQRLLPRSLLVLRGPSQARRVALTFDDGPDALTRDYLDVLDAYGAKATFFLVGQRCVKRPADVAEIGRRGHEVGGHGFTHTTFPDLNRRALVDELERTRRLLPRGKTRRPLLRPPRGILSAAVLLRCAAAGYTTVMWSLDTQDYKATDAAELTSRLAPDRLTPGDIVLLHEGRPNTLAALPAILGRLRDAGIAAVTVGELLGSERPRRQR